MRFGTHLLATMTVATLALPTAQAQASHPASAAAKSQMRPAGHARNGKNSYPRTELFLGYSYVRAAPTFAVGNRLVNLNGGSASVAFNLSRSIGLVTDFGGYADSRIQLGGPGALPAGQFDSNGNAFSMLFGPRFSYRRHDRIVPFAQVLAGGIYASSVALKNCTGAACVVLPAQTSFALTAGGGLDLKLSRHLALRLVQGEYLLTRLADTGTGIATHQNDIRLSSGLVFRFGGKAAQPVNHAPAVTCSVAPASGPDGVSIHASASDPDGDPMTYSWTASGGRVQGDGADVVWTPGGAQPGVYTVSVLVDDGRGGMATCTSNVPVAAAINHAPMLTCTISKTGINAGDPLQITATASDPDQDPITLSWETSGGRIVGQGNQVAIDTRGLPTGQITVRGHAFDGRGGTADCSQTVDVQAPVDRNDIVIEKEKSLALHSIYFPTAEPTVEQPNRGILPSQQLTLQKLADDFQVYLTFRPQAHLTLEGHADSRASAEYNVALTQRRVDATRTFLIERGVPEAALQVKALGESDDLTDEQVRDAVKRNRELTPAERDGMLARLHVIALASNRRVDITLQGTGQASTREYPFNAKDATTLLSTAQPGKHLPRKTTHR